MAHDVFISYSHTDKAIADVVCQRMEAAAGIQCWIAPRDIAHGKTWDDAVVDAVTASAVVVVIFSASANTSRNVLNEVATALEAGGTVIPFRIEDAPPTGALLLHLGRVHWLDAFSPPWEPHIDRLIESVSRNLAPRSETDQGRLEGGLERNPVPGDLTSRTNKQKSPADYRFTLSIGAGRWKLTLMAAVATASLLFIIGGGMWWRAAQPITSKIVASVTPPTGTFDCSGVSLPSSIVICSDPELMTLATEQQHVLNQARDSLTEEQFEQLLADQRTWVSDYATACGVPQEGPPPTVPVPPSIRECFKEAARSLTAYIPRYQEELTATAGSAGTCGFYMDRNGKQVPRPCADWRSDKLTPLGATAKCRDGSWAFSQHPSAPETCSQHGGVKSYR